MESTQMWAKLIYRFEGMTEKKTLYEIDQEFEKMCEMLQKNLASIKSLMPFLRSSLRQTMNPTPDP